MTTKMTAEELINSKLRAQVYARLSDLHKRAHEEYTSALIAQLSARLDVIDSILFERRRIWILVQNAYNVAEMEYVEAREAAEALARKASEHGCPSASEAAKLEESKAKHWAVMYALQEVRNDIAERGE